MTSLVPIDTEAVALVRLGVFGPRGKFHVPTSDGEVLCGTSDKGRPWVYLGAEFRDGVADRDICARCRKLASSSTDRKAA